MQWKCADRIDDSKPVAKPVAREKRETGMMREGKKADKHEPVKLGQSNDNVVASESHEACHGLTDVICVFASTIQVTNDFW